MVEKDRRGDELTASLPASEGWTEPLGGSVRAVYLFGAGHVGRALAVALTRRCRSRSAGSTFASRRPFPAPGPANVALIHAPEPTE